MLSQTMYGALVGPDQTKNAPTPPPVASDLSFPPAWPLQSSPLSSPYPPTLRLTVIQQRREDSPLITIGTDSVGWTECSPGGSTLSWIAYPYHSKLVSSCFLPLLLTASSAPTQLLPVPSPVSFHLASYCTSSLLSLAPSPTNFHSKPHSPLLSVP